MQVKILFVRPSMAGGGADRVTLNLLKHYDRNKYTCDLALMRAEGVFMDNIPAYTKVYDLKSKSLWSVWLPLFHLLRSAKYDVVYSTCGGASMPMMVAAILSRFKGLKIVSERNILFPPNKSKVKRKTMLAFKGMLFKRADWITAVSRGVKSECEEMLKLPENKVIVVNNPIIDQHLITLKNQEATHPYFQGDTPVLLAVGRMVKQKGYETLLKAFKKVKESSDARLLILGKGPLLSHYQEMAGRLGLEKSVAFAGFDINPFKYMSQCDCFVLSSNHEGMPGVLVQALACGAPCVSTDCPTGPNELIETGKNGFLVEVGDHEQMAKSILSILNNPQMATKFRENGPEAVTKYEWQAGVSSYFDFINA